MKHAPKNKISAWLFGQLGLFLLLALMLFMPQNRVWGFSVDLVPGVGETIAQSSMFIGENGRKIDYDASGFTVAPKNLPKPVSSYQKRITEHQKKLVGYKANPDAFDNKGILKSAPNGKSVRRSSIIVYGILENEIQTFQRISIRL